MKTSVQHGSLWLRAVAMLMLLAAGLSIAAATVAPARAGSAELDQFNAALASLDIATMKRLVYEIPDPDRMTAYNGLSEEMTKAVLAKGKEAKKRFNTLADFIASDGALLASSLAAARAEASGQPVATTGAIEGVVSDARTFEPVAGVTITMADKTATTDTNGKFRIDGIPQGFHPLTAEKPGKYKPATVRPAVLAGRTMPALVALDPVALAKVETGHISGRLTMAESGAPAAGYRVLLRSVNDGLDLFDATKVRTLETDQDGRFASDDFPAGKLLFQVAPKAINELPVAEELTLVANATLDIQKQIETLAPPKAAPVVVLTGHVIDALTGVPIAGSQVSAGQDHGARTGTDGAFRIAGIAPGEIGVRAGHDGYQEAAIDLGNLEAGTHKLTLKLKSATLGRLNVRVIDASTGGPLAAVRIDVGGKSGESDARGSVTIDGLTAGAVTLAARADKYLPLTDTAQIVAGEAREAVLKLTPITWGTVLGRVTDIETGVPLANVAVSAGPARAVTGADGRFQIDEVPAGPTRLDAALERYHDATASVEVEAAGQVNARIALAPITTGTLLVKLIDDETGKPIANGHVSAGTLTASSDETGIAHFEGIEAGDTTFEARHFLYHPAWDSVQVPRVDEVSATLRLAPITTGTVRGRVLSAADSSPIANATVRLGARTTSTDGNGHFELAKVPAGGFRLDASAPLFEPGSAQGNLARAGVAENVFRLTPITWGALHLVVRDAQTDAPIPGARVSLRGSDRTASLAGDVTFDKLKVGTAHLTASAEGYEPRQGRFPITAGETTDKWIPLVPIKIGDITGTIIDEVTGKPVAGAQITVGEQVVETDAQGHFSIAGVPAGEVSVTVRHADYGDATGSGMLGRGGKLALNIGLSARREDVAALGSALDANGLVDLYGIHFDSGKDQFRADSLPTLRAMLELMKKAPDQAYVIEGHTDSDGSDAYNQALSERRAARVVKWLADHGIAGARLNATGLGELRPVATNETDPGKALNRRVVLRRNR